MKKTDARELKTLRKLDTTTIEYMACEREKEELIMKMAFNRDFSRTSVVTLHLMQEHIDTLVKRIVILVGRCHRNQYDYDNEVATMLYDKIEPKMRRGFQDFDLSKEV